jgi:hypothetical protein
LPINVVPTSFADMLEDMATKIDVQFYPDAREAFAEGSVIEESTDWLVLCDGAGSLPLKISPRPCWLLGGLLPPT